MKQVVQRLRDGSIEVKDVPSPGCSPEGVLVDVRASLLSAGTERTKVEAGKKSLIGKARSRPDQVAAVIEKAQRDGVRATLDAVRTRLDQPSDLGYSTAGVIREVGDVVSGLAPGDRVACGGGGYAVHAEVNHVPGNLCVRLPDSVSFVHGAFATVGSIAMHGVRQADVRLGERVGVIGLGLVGQLTGKILRAAGCFTVGIDVSADRTRQAEENAAADVAYPREALGAELPEAARDCDAVIITAGTSSDDPVTLAAQLCRDRGTVVVVGAVGMNLPRPPFYDKELELRLSRSYGPGRYDRNYEERGIDYPIGYVRWTERRNMESFLELVGAGRIELDSLVTRRLPIDDAPEAYDQLLQSGLGLGVVLDYPTGAAEPDAVASPAPENGARPRQDAAASEPAPQPVVGLGAGLIGAGGFAQRILIPALRDTGFPLKAVASGKGLSARGAAERFGFERADSADAVLSDPEVALVVVATRHSSHAAYTEQALRAGKAAFVEKPPCLTEDELDTLRAARAASGRPLAVGFNRRHAPLAKAMREHVSSRTGPLEVIFRVNAGQLPDDHWLNAPDEGGGRLLGEGCHFIDFACWLVGSAPEQVSCTMRAPAGVPLQSAQSFAVNLGFADGSVASVLYAADGASKLEKERVEAHTSGRSAVLDDFATLTTYDGRSTGKQRSRSRDKGHAAQLQPLREQLEGRDVQDSLDPLDSMAATLAALRSAQSGRTVALSSTRDQQTR